MAITIEKVGEELNDNGGRRVYQVLDVTVALTAYSLIDALAPVIWNGLIKQNVTVRELGKNVWEGEVPYGILERAEEGSIDWNFKIGTSSLHITHALAHVKSYDKDGAITDPDRLHQGAIGVRNDGNGQSVEGCDVLMPVFSWSETHFFPYATVATHSWISTHEALVATCNQASWRIWAAGELLLAGVSGNKRGQQPVAVTYDFLSSRTVTGLDVGEISGIGKKGHEYLWVEYAPEEDTTSKRLTQRPIAVHVEQVYQEADWAANLPLPDPWS